MNMHFLRGLALMGMCLALLTACAGKKPEDDLVMESTAFDEDLMVDSPSDSATFVDLDTSDSVDIGFDPNVEALPGTEYYTPVARQDTYSTAPGYVSPSYTSTSQGYPEYNKPSRSYPSSSGNTHIVTKGDTLWSISRRYNVSVRALADANRIDPNAVLKIGKTLTIPSGKGSSVSSKAASSVSAGGAKVYTVQTGDSYYKIGKQFGISYQELMEYNGATTPDLKIGQEIKIP